MFPLTWRNWRVRWTVYSQQFNIFTRDALRRIKGKTWTCSGPHWRCGDPIVRKDPQNMGLLSSEGTVLHTRHPSLLSWHWKDEPPKYLAVKIRAIKISRITKLQGTEIPLLQDLCTNSSTLRSKTKATDWKAISKGDTLILKQLLKRQESSGTLSRDGSPGRHHFYNHILNVLVTEPKGTILGALPLTCAYQREWSAYPVP